MTTEQGQVRLEGDRRGIRFERRYHAAPAEVWSALTEPERMARWLAEAELDLRVGGAYVLRFSDTEGEWAKGKVLAVNPERLLEITWEYPGEPNTVVRLELSPDGDGTILVLDHSGLPTESAPGYGGGWHAHLDALDAHLGQAGIPDWWGRYRELAPLYEQQEAKL